MHAALVTQTKHGDREAFDALARLTGDRCMTIAFRILHDFDHPDDAVYCVDPAMCSQPAGAS